MFSSCTGSLGDIGKTMALVNSLEKIGISPEAASGCIGAVMSFASESSIRLIFQNCQALLLN